MSTTSGLWSSEPQRNFHREAATSAKDRVAPTRRFSISARSSPARWFAAACIPHPGGQRCKRRGLQTSYGLSCQAGALSGTPPPRSLRNGLRDRTRTSRRRNLRARLGAGGDLEQPPADGTRPHANGAVSISTSISHACT